MAGSYNIYYITGGIEPVLYISWLLEIVITSLGVYYSFGNWGISLLGIKSR
jgi:hypothetical protein